MKGAQGYTFYNAKEVTPGYYSMLILLFLYFLFVITGGITVLLFRKGKDINAYSMGAELPVPCGYAVITCTRLHVSARPINNTKEHGKDVISVLVRSLLFPDR